MSVHNTTTNIRTPGRDTYIDVLRTVAVARVVVLHALFLSWLTFVMPSMGVMFALGGSLMARSLDKHGWRAIGNRMRRMLPALWILGAVLIPIMLLAGWREEVNGLHPFDFLSLLNWIVPIFDPPGSDRLDESWKVLWYLRSYVWLIAFSPLLLWAFRRKPVLATLTPLALLFVIPNNAINDGGHLGSAFLDLLTYGTCWMLGFAHHDGWLQRIPRRRYVAIVVATAVAAVLALVPHLSDVSLQVTNHAILNVLWSATFVLVLLRIKPSMDWLHQRQRSFAMVRWVNQRAITIYLWHVPCILVAGWTLEMISNFDPRHLETITVSQGLALMALVVPLVALAAVTFGHVETFLVSRSPRLSALRSRLDRTPQVEDRISA